jgi:type I restriction enzyme S subunit
MSNFAWRSNYRRHCWDELLRERVRPRELVSWPFETWNPRTEPAAQFDYVDIASIDDVTKSIGATRRIAGALAPSRARRRIRVDDVLVSTTRPALNAVAMVPRELDWAICSTGLAILRADSRPIPRYLWYWVRTPEFASSLARAVAGALYPAVTDGDVLDQMVPVPSRERQAQIIEDLDARIASTYSTTHGIHAQALAAQALPLVLLSNAFRSHAA